MVLTIACTAGMPLAAQTAHAGGAIPIGSGFSHPFSVAVDGSGNVFVADQYHNAVKEIVAVGGVVSSSSAVNTIGSGFSVPSGVAVEGSGNVFVADQYHNAVKEIVAVGGVVSSSSPVKAIGSGFYYPTGVTVDGSDNVFVADFGNNLVKEIVAVGGVVSSSSTVNTIDSGFVAPGGVVEVGSGNIFVVDVGNVVATEIDLSDPPSLSFPTATKVGSTDSTDGARTVTLANSGNAVLNFPIPGSGNNPNISANFTLNSTSSGTCPLTGSTASTPGTLAAGASCTLPISFAPTVAGAISGSLVISDNNLNGNPATQTISLRGHGSCGAEGDNCDCLDHFDEEPCSSRLHPGDGLRWHGSVGLQCLSLAAYGFNFQYLHRRDQRNSDGHQYSDLHGNGYRFKRHDGNGQLLADHQWSGDSNTGRSLKVADPEPCSNHLQPSDGFRWHGSADLQCLALAAYGSNFQYLHRRDQRNPDDDQRSNDLHGHGR
jgi:NHL repeat